MDVKLDSFLSSVSSLDEPKLNRPHGVETAKIVKDNILSTVQSEKWYRVSFDNVMCQYGAMKCLSFDLSCSMT